MVMHSVCIICGLTSTDDSQRGGSEGVQGEEAWPQGLWDSSAVIQGGLLLPHPWEWKPTSGSTLLALPLLQPGLPSVHTHCALTKLVL